MSNIDDDIREEFAKHGSLFKTARKLDVRIEFAAKAVEGMEVEEVLDTSTCQFDGNGDPSKQKFLVARSLAKESWDNSIPEVAKARADYEAGTHELTLGRDGPYLLMYSIPRAVVKPQPNYFTPTVEG